MTDPRHTPVLLRHPDRFFIGGEWVAPSSPATFDVIDSHTETPWLTVPEARAADVDRAVEAAHRAFHDGPWPRLAHAERAEYLRAVADGVAARAEDFGRSLPRESGMVHSMARGMPHLEADAWRSYAGLADAFPFEEVATPSFGGFGR